MPDWNEDPVEVAEAAKWPLRLLTAPGYFQAHTAFSGVGFLRQREGKPFCVLHPEDAAKRGLKHGDEVRLFNDRGAIGLMLQVSDDIQPGVVLVPGQRPTSEAVSGTINMLCSDRYTDMGEGATYQSTWLDVGPWTSIDVAHLPVLRARPEGKAAQRSSRISDLKLQEPSLGSPPPASRDDGGGETTRTGAACARAWRASAAPVPRSAS